MSSELNLTQDNIKYDGTIIYCYNDYTIVIVALLIEHLLLFVKLCITIYLPNEPVWVKEALSD